MEWGVVVCAACAEGEEVLSRISSVHGRCWMEMPYFGRLGDGFAKDLDFEVAVGGVELLRMSERSIVRGSNLTVTDMFVLAQSTSE